MAIEGRSDAKAGGRIRLGMVGGGQGAFIGAVHRLAARMDDQYEFVAGALSSNAERSQASGRELGLAADRIYSDYREMAKAEARRKDGIEAVAIVTPNNVHVPAAKAFIEAGIHVICDKPLSISLKEAKSLETLLRKKNVLFALTHNYSGYPMIRHARDMVAKGELGQIRLVQAEYPQDWLTEDIEKSGQKQAAWRTDPQQSGGGAIGDIGTHAYQLATFVSGLTLDEVSADMTSFVKGRKVDDNVNAMLRFKNGARGMLWASQVAPGNENGLHIRVYGEKGGLEWFQENPNVLTYSPLGEPPRLIRRNGAGADAVSQAASRIPAGHPEGYLEAFAQLYTDIGELIAARIENRQPAEFARLVPMAADGIRGVRFIEASVKSSAANGAWTEV